MSYLVLARKWRPKNFDDIISQEFVTQSLKNAVSTGKTAHAFIFSGPRGVGKTSTARILAKALNCSSGPTPEPCSECPFCTEISEGKSLDVMEIDAASHTGVNDVREIIENIKYLPTSGKYKIYIIDEAHMLSQSAFNALLKTLEEPPPHVLFILATTEVHKIPVTILSRCQKYDFRKVPVEKIKETLSSITKVENIGVEDETLYLVAHEADGSLRDALSLMDQLIATFGNDIKHEEAVRILGILDRALLKSIMEGILKRDPKSCIDILTRAVDKGISPKRFAEDLLRTIRHALLIKTCGKEAVSELSEEDKDEIQKLASGETVETLELLFNLMLEGAESVQRSFYPQMALELTLIKLSTLNRTLPIDDIIKKLDSLSGTTPSGSGPAPRRQPSGAGRSGAAAKSSAAADSEPQVRDAETNIGKSEPNESNKAEFLRFVKSRNALMGTRLDQAKEIHIDGSVVRIVFNTPLHSEYFRKSDNLNTLKSRISDFFEGDLDLVIEESDSPAENDPKVRMEKRNENKKKIHNDPVLKEAIEVFGGRVVSVKPKQRE